MRCSALTAITLSILLLGSSVSTATQMLPNDKIIEC
jgi:hypothetical protein